MYSNESQNKADTHDEMKKKFFPHPSDYLKICIVDILAMQQAWMAEFP